MKNGCAVIIGIAAFLYALSHPEWFVIVGLVVAVVAIIAVVGSISDKKRAAAAAIAKAKADAEFLRTIPSVVLPAISARPPTGLDRAHLPSVDAPMPIPSQNPLKYGDNVKALSAHVDYLDARQNQLRAATESANAAYAGAVGALEKQQADLYRLAHRAAENVASIEARFPGFAARLDEVASGWVPPKVPVPHVYSPGDIAKALRWLNAAPTSQIAQAAGRGDWRVAIVATGVTVAVKAFQFQKIVREVDTAHHVVALSAKKAAAQRDELAQAYARVAAISAEVQARSTTLLDLLCWFEAQEQAGLFAQPALGADTRRKLIEMASFAHLARGRAAQAA